MVNCTSTDARESRDLAGDLKRVVVGQLPGDAAGAGRRGEIVVAQEQLVDTGNVAGVRHGTTASSWGSSVSALEPRHGELLRVEIGDQRARLLGRQLDERR